MSSPTGIKTNRSKFSLFFGLCWVFVVARGLSLAVAHRLKLPRGTWDLSSPTRVQTQVPCIDKQILNHQTTSKVPKVLSLSCSYSSGGDKTYKNLIILRNSKNNDGDVCGHHGRRGYSRASQFGERHDSLGKTNEKKWLFFSFEGFSLPCLSQQKNQKYVEL